MVYTKVRIFTGLGYYTATVDFYTLNWKTHFSALQKVHLVHRADRIESKPTLSDTTENMPLSTKLGPAEK